VNYANLAALIALLIVAGIQMVYLRDIRTEAYKLNSEMVCAMQPVQEIAPGQPSVVAIRCSHRR
jgi:hypothetical protein